MAWTPFVGEQLGDGRQHRCHHRHRRRDRGRGGVTGTGGMTTTDGGTDTGSTTDPHTVHLDIINKATTGGVPVTRPAPAVSYSDCKI